MLKQLSLLLIVSIILTLSCSKREEKTIPSADNFIIGDLEFQDPWIRSAAVGMNTALFFSLKNRGKEADTLFKVESGLSEVSEIHETYEVKEDVLGMREVEFIAIESSQTFHFKPRGFHIMLIKLVNDLKSGEKGSVKLFFKRAGEIELSAPVKDFTMKGKMNHSGK